MLFGELMRHIENEKKISVSLEVRHPLFLQCAALKLAPDQYLHHIQFCRAAKLHDGNRSCAANKKRSLALANHGRCFAGKCPFGIIEYAFPVRFQNRTAAVLYLGGLMEPDWQPPTFFHGELPRTAADDWRSELRDVGQFLCRMLEIELCHANENVKNKTVKRRSESYYLESCAAFIKGHYQENIALSDLSTLLGVNPNYLGGLLRRQLHSTFRRQLLNKRLEEAEILLKFHPQLSITEIAHQCGFSDSNYFTAQFHRERGLTPTAFRKSSGPFS